LETQSRQRGKAFDDDILRERFEQFAKILLEHNTDEEELYQAVVKVCGESRVDSSLRIPEKVQKVIEAYGVERYRDFMRQTNE